MVLKMAEYIDLEAAFNAITDLAGKASTRSAYESIWKSARALKKIPAADVAPVVQCKDCRKFKTYACRMVASGYDDFCSYGERKEE